MTKAPAIRFHQLLVPEHAAPSQHPPPLLLNQLLFSRQWSTSQYLPVSIFTYLISKQLQYHREQPMAYIPPHPFPKNTGKKSTTNHQQSSFQHLHHVANPLCNLTSLSISLASFHHFYLVQTPKNSKLLLSCFL